VNNYTVLLLRPDYIADEFGKDTYLAHVVADGVDEAIKLGQREAWDVDQPPDVEDDVRDYIVLEDYHVLLVCIGHLEDLKP
jgi:hypothetical protein